MNKFLVFNHHSLPLSNREQAEELIPVFLKICIKCRNIGLNTILVDESIDSSWFNVKITEGYYWRDWYKQHKNDALKDLLRAFRSIQTNQPFFSEEDIAGDVELFEVEYEEETNFSALRAAAWNEAPIASFPINRIWEKNPLPIIIRIMEKEDEMHEQTGEIANLYSLDVYEGFQIAYLKERNALFDRASELYNQWNIIFPYLTFCGKVKEQLIRWSASSTLLSQVIESLTILNSFCEQWQDGGILGYSHEGLRSSGLNHMVSGESDNVRNNPVLRNERIFWLPNGENAFFENHIKISQGYRIHFYPDSNTKRIFIGYIGKHLKL